MEQVRRVWHRPVGGASGALEGESRRRVPQHRGRHHRGGRGVRSLLTSAAMKSRDLGRRTRALSEGRLGRREEDTCQQYPQGAKPPDVQQADHKN